MRHLTVVSYNIHRGVGLDRRRDLDRIADVIGEVGPDVVGLQEVIREDGVPDADQAAYLAARLEMSELVMGETRAHGTGIYGSVDFDVDGTPLHVFNCHFGLALRERREQLGLLGAFIRASGRLAGPRVLLGDFNEWHRGPVTRGLRREFASPMRRRRTHPAMFPLFALDRIYWDAELEGEEFSVHRSRLARVASDHLPVVARLRLRYRPPRLAPYVIGDALPPPE